MRGLAILGSTGSVGTSALAIAAQFPDRFRVVALAAGRRLETLVEQIVRFRPGLVSVGRPEDVSSLRALLEARGLGASVAGSPEVCSGESGNIAVATHPEAVVVLGAIVGAVGLAPTLAALRRRGIIVAIANKEPLVVAGALCMETARRHGSRLIPVDSEHSALFQCLAGHRAQDVRRVILTGSGGPLRTIRDLGSVTVEQALAHPTWSMGPKITIDSATLMNKGLEVIEARWLFDLSPRRIDVLIHPQSIVHSMVEYLDGSVLAQMGPPDMRLPIAYALGYPERLPLDLSPLDLSRVQSLTFEPPDEERFPCLGLAYRALETGGTAPAVLSAANEVAVQAFLSRRIAYLAIARLIEAALDDHPPGKGESLEELLDADRWARERTARKIESMAG